MIAGLNADVHVNIFNALNTEDLLSFRGTSLEAKNFIDNIIAFKPKTIDKMKYSQKIITSEITECDEKIKLILENKIQSDVENNNLQDEKELINQIKQKLLNELDKIERPLKALKIVHDLFGGEEKYYQLSVLDIQDREEKTLWMNFIRSDELTAPIMRGVDKNDRHFFAIKTDQDKAQVFFQKGRYSGDWAWGGPNFIDAQEIYIINNAIITEDVKTQLEKSLQEILPPNG